jgi:putative transcriptional regulator
VNYGSFISTEKDFKMSKDHITNNIRHLRFHKDEMTQQQLADKCGVTRQTIVAIEKGKYFPTLELSFRIAKAFETSLDQVFTYDASKDKIRSKKNKSKGC